MNLTAMKMYWITRLDDIGACLLVLSIMAGIAMTALVISYVLLCADHARTNEGAHCFDREVRQIATTKQWLKRSVAVFAVLMSAAVLVPTKKDMLVILGVPAVLNSKVVQEDLPKVYNGLLMKIMEELQMEESKEGKE